MRYCTNCGFELEEDSNFCTNCGTPVDNSSKNAEVQDKPIEEPVQTQRETRTEPIVRQQPVSYETGYTPVNNNAAGTRAKTAAELMQEEAEKAAMQAARYRRNTGSTQYMSTAELWSWLKKDAKRQLFFTNEENTMTEDEFIQKLSAKMWDNNVPAKIERKMIEWDRSGVRDNCCIVSPYTNAVNPISFVIRFNHVGKFSFVEEKTFITPPELPEVPGTPIATDIKLNNAVSTLLIGILMFIVGMNIMQQTQNMGMILFLAGLVLTAVGGYNTYRYNEIAKHNQKCAEQERAWNRAWNNWRNSIFKYSFQEDINGQLSRIFDSVFGCIKQVSEEIFNEKPAIEEDDSQRMSELEEMINSRRNEYGNGNRA